jgi:predicted NBD/HSP70 family sugar kinase
VPILIDNDVNVLTLAEHRRYWPDQRHLLYIKAGIGVGSGMVISGNIDRRAHGAAGGIGMPISTDSSIPYADAETLAAWNRSSAAGP